MIGAVLDITQLIKSEEKLTYLAHYDELTRLPNRSFCNETLKERIELAKLSSQKFAVLYADLDNFKTINDTQGHIIGDDFLREVSNVLLLNLPDDTFISRLGGDEFILLTKCREDIEVVRSEAVTLAEKVIEVLNIGKTYNNFSIDITVSIGISIYPEHGTEYSKLLGAADQAMYQTKEKGRKHFELYNSDIEDRRLRQIKLIADIKTGLLEKQFHVCFQAKQNLSNNELAGCEALIRWQHPESGNIPPSEFIPLAESTGLIIPLGLFVLEQSCLFIKQWQDYSNKPLPVSVNVSSEQLKSPSFTSDVQDIIGKTGIKGSSLELEITESLLMEDVEKTIDTLLILRELGVTISIDDFGTGYSSLSYLKKLPVDTLKIDKTFIDGLPDSDDDVSIVTTILALADQLHLKTVAEGVNSELQKEFLATLGCNFLQGYFYSKPIDKDEFFQRFIN